MSPEKTSTQPHKAARPARPKRRFARMSSPARLQESAAPVSVPRNNAMLFLRSHKSSTQSSPVEETAGRGLGNDNIFSRNRFGERNKVPPSTPSKAIANVKTTMPGRD